MTAFPFLWLTAVLFASAPSARGAWGVAFAPHDTSDARAGSVVYLHGMWASPEDSCDTVERACGDAALFVACPRGNARLGETGLKMWSGSWADAARQVHAALDAAEALAPGRLDRTGGTLVGYSNGAWFAAEIAAHEPGRWTSLVLLSMQLEVDAARLRAAGVTRVALGAGRRDAARSSLQSLERVLSSSGMQARFFDLGDAGHELPSDMDARLTTIIAWARGS